MKNKNGIIKTIAYWIFTGLLTAMLLFSGIGALLKFDFLVEAMEHVSMPFTIMPILGIAYILGAIAIVLPGFLQLKEWAHVGVFFAMVAAISIHIMIGDNLETSFGSILLMLLNVTSFILRPANRRYRREVLAESKVS